jgi:hypothetical protein
VGAIYYSLKRASANNGEIVNEVHVLSLRELCIRAYSFFILTNNMSSLASCTPVVHADKTMTFHPGDMTANTGP